jgi:RND family efflux transporter MFP subunit
MPRIEEHQMSATLRSRASAPASIAGLALCALLTACGRQPAPPPVAAAPAAPAEVHVTRLGKGSITRSVVLPAQVLPDQQATLYAKVSGYLQAINVDKGDRVKAGEVLARIEVPELLAARAKQQAELKTAEAEYGRLEQSLRRAPDLVVPQMVDQARGRMEIARATLDESETMLKYATVTAPFDGVVTQRFVDPGALIQAGTSNGAALLTLMNFDKVRLQVAVPEAEATRVSVGQPVSVGTDAMAGRNFEGKVARFSYALDAASRTMMAEVSLANAQLLLRPGMLVTAKLGIERHEGVPVLPAEAIVMEKANAFVYAVVAGKAAKRPVKLGFTDGKQAEVLDGVKPEDEIILAAQSPVSDGQAVRVAAP